MIKNWFEKWNICTCFWNRLFGPPKKPVFQKNRLSNFAGISLYFSQNLRLRNWPKTLISGKFKKSAKSRCFWQKKSSIFAQFSSEIFIFQLLKFLIFDHNLMIKIEKSEKSEKKWIFCQNLKKSEKKVGFFLKNNEIWLTFWNFSVRNTSFLTSKNHFFRSTFFYCLKISDFWKKIKSIFAILVRLREKLEGQKIAKIDFSWFSWFLLIFC